MIHENKITTLLLVLKPKTVLLTKINFISKFYGIQHSIKTVLQLTLLICKNSWNTLTKETMPLYLSI